MSWACTGKGRRLQKGNRGEKPSRYRGKRPLPDVGSKRFGSGAPSTRIRQIAQAKLTKGNRESEACSGHRREEHGCGGPVTHIPLTQRVTFRREEGLVAMGAFILATVVAPFAGSFMLDLLFGTWVRWWLSPILVGLAGVGFIVWSAVTPDGPGTRTEIGWPVWVFFFVLLPVVLSASGAWARRWVARSAAKRPSIPTTRSEQEGDDPRGA